MSPKITNSSLYFFLNIIPLEKQLRFLRFKMRKHVVNNPISLSCLKNNLKRILFVFPEDPVEAVLQLPTLFALKEIFVNAKSSLFCKSNIARLLHGVSGLPDIYSYEPESIMLFSESAKNWIELFEKQHFDACFFLDRNPDIMRCYICAQSGIPVRVSYFSVELDQFFNLMVKPRKSSVFAGDKNFAVVRGLGAGNFSYDRFKWNINDIKKKDALNFLKRLGITDVKKLAGVSAGMEASLLDELIPYLIKKGRKVILMNEVNEKGAKAESIAKNNKNVFLCPAVPLDQTACILNLCEVFVSGRIPLLYLALYAGTPVTGVFKEEESDLWAKPSSAFKAVVADKDSKKTVSRIMEKLDSILL